MFPSIALFTFSSRTNFLFCLVLTVYLPQSFSKPRAVRLFPGDPRTPFDGALIDQEMHTRGQYPYEPDFADRPIELPIRWQIWVNGADKDATTDTCTVSNCTKTKADHNSVQEPHGEPIRT
jgi:hypothetical protein